jgi:glyoxylase-like metal-dependent hydrolase (beta-lactamase superfamily II)
MSLQFNNEEIRLMHFPSAHTDTDLVVHFVNSNVFHLGDLFNAGVASFPSVDIDSGGTLRGLENALAALLEIIPPGAKIIPGHYDLADAASLRRTYRMVVDTVGQVREGKAAGLDLAEIQEKGFSDLYRDWGKTGYTSAEDWIANIFMALETGQ